MGAGDGRNDIRAQRGLEFVLAPVRFTGVPYKDLFSKHAVDYARFRPRYPAELFAWLAQMAPTHGVAVDVGAGNGQAADALAAHFARVIAVEPSADQIANSSPAANVSFQRGAAESTGVEPAVADLLVAAQAFHWFDRDGFFAEARRIARRGACLAVWCYGLGKISPELDAVVYELYETRLGPFWDPERKLVESAYRDIEFPFDEIDAPAFRMTSSWGFDHLLGYLGTWSALKRFMKTEGSNPLEDLLPRLREAWGDAEVREVSWPLGMRVFRV